MKERSLNKGNLLRHKILVTINKLFSSKFGTTSLIVHYGANLRVSILNLAATSTFIYIWFAKENKSQYAKLTRVGFRRLIREELPLEHRTGRGLLWALRGHVRQQRR